MGRALRRRFEGGRSEQRSVLAEVHGSAIQTRADPDDVTRSAERVEIRGPVRGHTPRQHVALPERDRQRERPEAGRALRAASVDGRSRATRGGSARARPARPARPRDAARRASPVGCGAGRPGRTTRARCPRAEAHRERASRLARASRARLSATASSSPNRAASLGGRERPMRSRVPAQDGGQSVGHGLEEDVRDAAGRDHAEGIADEPRILDRGQRLHVAEPNPDRTPLPQERLREAAVVLAFEQRPGASEKIVQLVGVSGRRAATRTRPARWRRDRAARAAPRPPSARAGARDRARAPARAAPRAACRPRTCTSRRSRRGARTRTGMPKPSRLRRDRARGSGSPSGSRAARAGRRRPAGTRDTSRARSGTAGSGARPGAELCAFSRCCQSGVRWPGRRRGMRSAREAFSRKREPKSADCPSSAMTSSSMSPGSSRRSSRRRRHVGIGEVERDAVVRPDRLRVDAERVPEPRRQRHRPGRVHASAERRQHADAPVADLVAEALDDDRAVGGDDPRGGLLLAQIRDADFAPPARRGGTRRAARSPPCRRRARRARARHARSSRRAPPAARPLRPSRTERRRARRAQARRGLDRA